MGYLATNLSGTSDIERALIAILLTIVAFIAKDIVASIESLNAQQLNRAIDVTIIPLAFTSLCVVVTRLIIVLR